MAVNATDGYPIIASTDAPDVPTHMNAVSQYAAERGTRLIGTTAQRNAYAYKKKGLEWYDTTDDSIYVYNGTGWKIWHRSSRTWTPTTTNVTGTPTITARYSIASGRVFCDLNVTLSGANFGSAPLFSLPVESVGKVGNPILGQSQYVGGGSFMFGVVFHHSTTQMAPVTARVSGANVLTDYNVTATNPFTWASGHTLSAVFNYDAA